MRKPSLPLSLLLIRNRFQSSAQKEGGRKGKKNPRRPGARFNKFLGKILSFSLSLLLTYMTKFNLVYLNALINLPFTESLEELQKNRISSILEYKGLSEKDAQVHSS